MSTSNASLSVATTATRLDDAVNTRATSGLLVTNTGASTVYLGGAAVTTTTGTPLAAGGSASFDLRSGDVLYGVVAAGTNTVMTLQIGA